MEFFNAFMHWNYSFYRNSIYWNFSHSFSSFTWFSLNSFDQFVVLPFFCNSCLIIVFTIAQAWITIASSIIFDESDFFTKSDFKSCLPLMDNDAVHEVSHFIMQKIQSLCIDQFWWFCDIWWFEHMHKSQCQENVTHSNVLIANL